MENCQEEKMVPSGINFLLVKPRKGSLAIAGDCYGRRIHQEQFRFFRAASRRCLS